MRFRFIEDRCVDYPVRILCDVLEVSPAGHYAWRSRRRAGGPRDPDIVQVKMTPAGRFVSVLRGEHLRQARRGPATNTAAANFCSWPHQRHSCFC
jgi:putative transposase